MKKRKLIIALIVGLILSFSVIANVSAATTETTTYKVVSGDSLWKIAVKNQVGVSELISLNPQLSNPDLIYPGDIIKIPAISSSVRAYETEVVRLVNEQRAKYGLKPLTENWELSRVARYKSQDMHDKKYFSHTSPTYGSPFTMMTNFGIKYRTAGENIAMGYATPQAVVTAWMNSSGHRANILNASYTQIGVGYVAAGNYWTQEFIG
jgi:uncharacterized YkwD family protein/spore coat assembly protein SafA